MTGNLVETLTSYVPALVVRRLAADPNPINEPTAERMAAAVLFADVTNFTAFADQLAQRGLVGSEELAHALNDFFGRIIDIVHTHGGEVTKFAGDALLALWPVSSEIARLSPAAQKSLSEMALRAAQCGLAIQRTLGDYASPEGARLSLQVGIGAGDVYSVHLGGVYDRWEFLLSGTPLAQMTVAKEQARPGQIVLSPEVWQLTRRVCDGRKLDTGFVHLLSITSPLPAREAESQPVIAEAEGSLQSYVPAAVLSRIAAGHEEWLSELRRVAVLFIKLPRYGTSIRHPYERTIPRAQEVMVALQTALYKYAGSINKLNVDDKGITLVAALGMPPLTHLDDAVLAVHAALEMQLALEELGRESAIGITTGWVFCGPIGNKRRREYTMVGNAVNMAARLMQAAEAGLATSERISDALCDQSTHRAVRELAASGHRLAGKLLFEELPQLGVKGRIEPVAAYRPRLKLSRSQSRSHVVVPLSRPIDRATELAFLGEQLRRLSDSEQQDTSEVVFIEAEAGMGKSVLVGQMLEEADRLSYRTLVGAGHLLQQDRPYFAWQPIFHKLFGLDALYGDTATLRAHVLSQLPSVHGERGYPAFAIRLSPFLNSVLPLDFPENKMTLRMTGQLRRRTTRLLLLRLLQRIVSGKGGRKRASTLLVLENGQWLDDESWDLLLLVARQVRSLLTVVATRPLGERAQSAPLPGSCQQLINETEIRWLRLEELSLDQMMTVICQALAIDSFPEDALTVLTDKAGGNPYLGLELVRSWLDAGLIRIEDQGVFLPGDVRALENAPVPDPVQMAITSRLERLTPAQQLVLKTASVLGTTFTLDDLTEIYPIAAEKEKLLEYLESVLELGFLLRNGPDSGHAFSFKYGLTQEVAHSLLLFSQRRQLEECSRKVR
jgi:class 3 adenylate cyclase